MNVVLFAQLLGCSESKPQHNAQDTSVLSEPPAVWKEYSVQESGPFSIGHIGIEHTYVHMEGAPERSIFIDIWYPTLEESGDAAIYRYGTDPRAFEDAVPAEPVHAQGYPVLVHSHGNRAIGSVSSAVMIHFASHGWVVAAPSHTDNLTTDTDPLPLSHYLHRPMDIQQSLDVVAAQTFAGGVAMDKVLMTGHSFGAEYTAWASAGANYDNVEAVCEEGEGVQASGSTCTDAERAIFESGALKDERVAASIHMAGSIRSSFFGAEGYKAVETPILCMTGSNDNPDEAQRHYDQIVDIDFRWLELEGGCHESFGLGFCDSLDPERGFEIIGAYALAFGRYHILQDDTPFLEDWLYGAEQPFEEATLQFKE